VSWISRTGLGLDRPDRQPKPTLKVPLHVSRWESYPEEELISDLLADGSLREVTN
jgi:hypothetical protein